MRRRCAFTLVELLVVIGIIAVLVGILLPTLGNARKAAKAVKCAASLKEIGNAMLMYASEYQGWSTPARISASAATPYNVDGFNFTNDASGVYWINLLAKYVTKGKIGTASGSGATADTAAAIDQRITVFWGCPEFQGYSSTTVGGVNRVQTGYGINPMPRRTADFPAIGLTTASSPEARRNTLVKWGIVNGRGAVTNIDDPQYPAYWPRWKDYQYKSSEHMMVADSSFFQAESQAKTDDEPPYQVTLGNQQTWASGPNGDNTQNATMVDLYRHGKYPNPSSNAAYPWGFSNRGGTYTYNILYGDGHVQKQSGWQEAFRSMRLRFPN